MPRQVKAEFGTGSSLHDGGVGLVDVDDRCAIWRMNPLPKLESSKDLEMTASGASLPK